MNKKQKVRLASLPSFVHGAKWPYFFSLSCIQNNGISSGNVIAKVDDVFITVAVISWECLRFRLIRELKLHRANLLFSVA